MRKNTAADSGARLRWFKEARFGMFVHWGLYAQLGRWQGKVRKATLLTTGQPVRVEQVGRLAARGGRRPRQCPAHRPGRLSRLLQRGLKGITFSHTEWWLPESFEDGFVKGDVGGFIQAAFGVPAAVFAEGARHCAFDQCRITNVGGYGIELGRGCQGNRISHCEISDLGAGGIKIGEPLIRSRKDEHTHSNSVADSHIHHGGEIFHSGIGIWVGQSYDNRFAHNHLHDFYYSGFSVGWTWGYGPALAGGNIVEFNHVHHIGVRSDGDGPILSDMGGIYTLGTQHGTIIRNNVFHDIMGLRYGGWGIYNDEGSTGIVSENNLVYRTTHGGYHQHYGKENVVRNNIFAFARDFQVQLSRAEEHLSFTFERNIVFWKNSQLVSGRFTTALFEMDHNLYWQQGRKTPTLGESTWKEWQARGKDPHSLFADPKFADPKSGDFRLLKGTPASEIGFKIFTWDKVGPRKRTRLDQSGPKTV